MYKYIYLACLLIFFHLRLFSQGYTVQFEMENQAQPNVEVNVDGIDTTYITDILGRVQLNAEMLPDSFRIIFTIKEELYFETELKKNPQLFNRVSVSAAQLARNKVIITGGIGSASARKTPISTQAFTIQQLNANLSSNFYEAMQTIPGLRQQINCNVCGTSNIRIHGLDGSYTLVLIDGMPVMSSLGSVYGLQGIPLQIVDRVEVVKGAASTQYGSEAMGGVINIITKNIQTAPKFASQLFWIPNRELNADLSFKFNSKEKKFQHLIGAQAWIQNGNWDINKDNFKDITDIRNLGLFYKGSIRFKTPSKKMSITARFMAENRNGGQLNWTTKWKGSDSIYGESIATRRAEVAGQFSNMRGRKSKDLLQWSYVHHFQNSYYGTLNYNGNQVVGFAQYQKNYLFRNKELALGVSYRYNYLDDNTAATEIVSTNQTKNSPFLQHLPGCFLQVQTQFAKQVTILSGVRFDYNSVHKEIITPRLNVKWESQNLQHTLRLGLGSGYRVANIFTEDHAALTGARKIIFLDELNPEKSWSANLVYDYSNNLGDAWIINMRNSVFYTYFTNKIWADYLSNTNAIIYSNLNGYAVSKGFTSEIDLDYKGILDFNASFTRQEVIQIENNKRAAVFFNEKYFITWRLSYNIKKYNITLDYTGNCTGPMRLPLLSSLDKRPEFSPVFSLQNIQITKKWKNKMELIFTVKNILNYYPNQNIIARAHDPFDKNVVFDSQGTALPTPENPQALTFDPNYTFAPMIGRRLQLGLRYRF